MCKKRRGCGKCRMLVFNHTTPECEQSQYPRYDQQYCDYCFRTDSRHEAKNCRYRPVGCNEIPVCKTCGHFYGLDPEKEVEAPCTLWPPGYDPPNMDAYMEIVNQFTPLYRTKYLNSDKLGKKFYQKNSKTLTLLTRHLPLSHCPQRQPLD